MDTGRTPHRKPPPGNQTQDFIYCTLCPKGKKKRVDFYRFASPLKPEQIFAFICKFYQWISFASLSDKLSPMTVANVEKWVEWPKDLLNYE